MSLIFIRWRSAVETLAKLHRVDYETIGLSTFGKPTGYYNRQLKTFTAITNQQAAVIDADTKEPVGPIPHVEEMIQMLRDNQPADRTSIVHGDFKLDNLMFHPTEPRVIGILDWELSTIGHPLADLGFVAMPFHTSPDEYGGILGAETPGIPDEAEFFAAYRDILPQVPAPQPFHIAFALFRFAVMFVGIADRAKAGNAADPEAARYAPLAGRFAQRAWQVLEEGSGQE